MRTIYFFGYNLNGLEYVTYVIIPAAIVLVILVFIYFNLRLLRTSFNVSHDDKNKFLDLLFEDDLLPLSISDNKNKVFSSNQEINLKLNNELIKK